MRFYEAQGASRRVEILDQIRAEKDTLLRGATLLVGGLALLVAGNLVGLAEGQWMQVWAGVLAVTGIVIAFLGFFVYLLPPLLPAK